MKGYQYLEMDFFDLCKTRRIKRLPMLLFIYLRGLYCRFQKPVFTWRDSDVIKHLGISRPTLQKCRKELAEKGLLLFIPGNGLSHPTEYTLLGNILLPELKVKVNKPKGERILHLPQRKVAPSTISSYQQVKNRVGIFEGSTPKDKALLDTALGYKGDSVKERARRFSADKDGG